MKYISIFKIRSKTNPNEYLGAFGKVYIGEKAFAQSKMWLSSMAIKNAIRCMSYNNDRILQELMEKYEIVRFIVPVGGGVPFPISLDSKGKLVI